MKLLMSAKELFKNCKTIEEEKKRLISYASWLYARLDRPLIRKDFRVKGRITSIVIDRLFGTFSAFMCAANLPTKIRKVDMSDEELKEYLVSIATKTSVGCWITEKYPVTTHDGRHQIRYKSKQIYLHRLSYLLHKGNIPKHKIIMHTCDNPPCFNPAHLVAGSYAENAQDRENKNRRKSVKKKRKHHNIKDIYDQKQVFSFVKNNIKITKKEEWLYTGKLTSCGYPYIYYKGKNYRLHRLILALKLDKKYEDIDIARHYLSDKSQPDKRDLNPKHLIEGTRSDNSIDALSYRKNIIDSDLVNLVKKDLVKIVFSKHGDKMKFDKKWAKKLNVGIDTIKDIRRNKTWSHL